MSVERTHPTLHSIVPHPQRAVDPRAARSRGKVLVTGLQLPDHKDGRQEFEAEDDRSGGAVLHVNFAGLWCMRVLP